jgi:hypothetical protein
MLLGERGEFPVVRGFDRLPSSVKPWPVGLRRNVLAR